MKTIFNFIGGAAILIGIFILTLANCGAPVPETAKQFVGTAIKGTNALSPVLPFDVVIPPEDTVMETTIRRDFDLFSWKSFIALNWPLDSGQVIGAKGDNDTGWEGWKESFEIFLPKGKKPNPWGVRDTLQFICTDPGKKLLMQVGKTPGVLSEVVQPFQTGPLIDQNGAYTRYEILVNKLMFNYILDNGLYSFVNQQKFQGPVKFPEGNNDLKTWGAIMVKASWKLLGKGDDPSRFHTADANIYVPAPKNSKSKDTCFVAKVGLVGMHIGTKTESCPQWIWSTFEQVDNVPTFGEGDANPHYNYYNKSSGATNLNKEPARPWGPNIPGQKPSQIARLDPVFAGTQALNTEFQAMLRAVNPASVWQYYQLVGTQWPVHKDKLPLGDPFPLYLANTTMETYIQGIIQDNKPVKVPNVSSSCLHCHNGATMKSNGKASDFTYLLERAQ